MYTPEDDEETPHKRKARKKGRKYGIAETFKLIWWTPPTTHTRKSWYLTEKDRDKAFETMLRKSQDPNSWTRDHIYEKIDN